MGASLTLQYGDVLSKIYQYNAADFRQLAAQFEYEANRRNLVAFSLETYLRGVYLTKEIQVLKSLKQNLEAADIVFEKTEMAALAAIDLNNRYIKGDFWCLPGSDYTLESLWEQ